MKGIEVVVVALALIVLAVACGGGNTEEGGATPPGSATASAGGAIALIGSSTQKTTTDVYLLDPDSGNLQQLTDTSESEWWPRWSRDGQRLAWIVTAIPQTPAGGTAVPAAPTERQLVVANADGSDQRRMGGFVLLQTFSGGFSWSPAGGQIVYMASTADDPSTSRLRVVNVADGSEVTLRQDQLGYLPDWSPRGTQIVFGAFVGEPDASGNRESELFLISSNGTDVRQLTNRPGPDVDPTWSPDGSRIAWWGQDPPTEGSPTPPNRLFMLDVQSGEVTELGEGADPVWSPDGQHIAFVLEQTPEGGTVEPTPNPDIWVIDVETGARTRLTQDPASDLWPAWSPDGQRLAFVSERDNSNGEVYAMNADGSGVHRITDNDLSEAMLAWKSP